MDLVNTLQKINNIVPNLTVSQLLDIINIINEPKLTIDNMLLKGLKEVPHNGLITIDTNNNKTTSTENPFTVSNYL